MPRSGDRKEHVAVSRRWRVGELAQPLKEKFVKLLSTFNLWQGTNKAECRHKSGEFLLSKEQIRQENLSDWQNQKEYRKKAYVSIKHGVSSHLKNYTLLTEQEIPLFVLQRTLKNNLSSLYWCLEHERNQHQKKVLFLQLWKNGKRNTNCLTCSTRTKCTICHENGSRNSNFSRITVSRAVGPKASS